MKKSTFMTNFGKPILVLFLLSFVIALLLAYVNSVTEPVIAENDAKRAEEMRMEALPGAKSFEEIPVEDGWLVTGIYRETTGQGYVMTAENNGYADTVTVTVGISAEGKIVRVLADCSSETQGVGSRAGEENYLSRFVGIEGTADSVDTLTNATYSSTAVKKGVEDVLTTYRLLTEGGNQ